jgi:hypothetical protein
VSDPYDTYLKAARPQNALTASIQCIKFVHGIFWPELLLEWPEIALQDFNSIAGVGETLGGLTKLRNGPSMDNTAFLWPRIAAADSGSTMTTELGA